MKLSIIGKISLAFSAGLTALILIFFLSLYSVEQYLETSDVSDRSKNTILNLENIISGLKEAEAGYRGYLLSNDYAFLNNYQGAHLKVQESLFRIRSIAGRMQSLDKPDLLDSLDMLINEQSRNIDSIISLHLTGEKKEAYDLFLEKKGVAKMAKINQIINKIQNKKEKEISAASLQLQSSNKLIFLYIITFCFTATIITCTSFLVIRSDIKKRIYTEARLIDSERKFKALFEQSGEATFLCEEDVISDCNEAALKVLGSENKNDIIRKSFLDFAPEKQENGELSSKLLKQYLYKLSKAGGVKGEFQFFDSHKNPFVGELSLTLIQLGDKNRIYGVLRNITEKKKAEEELIQSQRFIKKVTDASPDIISVLNYPDRKPGYTNRSVSNLLGYVHEIDIFDKVHPEDFEYVKNLYENIRYQEDEKISDLEYRVRDCSRQWRWFYERVKIFNRNSDNWEVSSIISIVQDITHKKKVEEEIRAANRVLEGLYTNIPIIISTINKEGTILSIQGSGLQKMGMKEYELIGKNMDEVVPYYADVIRQVFDNKPQSFILKVPGNNEDYYFQNYFFLDPERNTGIGLSIDITSQKKVEKEIQNTNLELQATLEELRNVEKNLLALNKELDIRVQQRTEELAKSEERFRLVSTVSNDAIWDWNLKTGEIWRSDGFNVIHEITPDAGRLDLDKWFEQVHPAEKEEVKNSLLDSVKNKKKEWSSEYRLLKPDGNFAVVIDKGIAMFDENGNVSRMVGSMQDVTKTRLAQQEIKNSEEEYRSLVTATSQIVWTTNNKGQIDYVPEWEVLTGQSKREMQGLGWLKVIHEEDREKTIIQWLKAVKKKSIFETEYRVKTKHGYYKYLLMRAVPVFKSNGEIRKWIGTCTDIHDRKVAEESLQKERELLSNILATIPHSVFWKDKNMKYMGCNTNFARDAGLSDPYLVIGKTDKDLPWSETETLRYEESDREVLETGEALYQVEEVQTRQNGTSVTLLLSKVPLKNNKGEVIGILGVYSDISKMKEVENSIRESEKELRLITDTLPQLIAYVDKNECFRFNNKKYEEWYEKEPFGIYGLHINELLDPKTYKYIQPHICTVLKGRSTSFEYSLTKNNKVHYFSVTYIPNFVNEEVEGFYVSEVDITEIKETGAILKETVKAMNLKNQELNRINKLLDTFVYAAAHDLKTPVTNLKMGMSLLNTIKEPRKQEAIRSGVEESLKRLELTINGLVQVIEIQNDNNKAIKKLSLNEIVINILNENKASIRKLHCKIETDFSEYPVVTYIEAYLNSILKNLISNAIKYSSDLRIPEIKINSKKSGGYCLITVEDNGIGMNLDKYEKNLFKPFTRFSKKENGKGIGLHLVKTMIEKNGGRISVKSEIEKGTTFYCYLKEYKL